MKQELGEMKLDARTIAFPERLGAYDDSIDLTVDFCGDERPQKTPDWSWYISQGITPEDIPFIDR